jgi:hypothetical protein
MSQVSAQHDRWTEGKYKLENMIVIRPEIAKASSTSASEHRTFSPTKTS